MGDWVLGHLLFFFSSRRRHTRFDCDWSSDVCSSDLPGGAAEDGGRAPALRPDRHQRIGGHRDGRGRPMSVSAHSTNDAETEQYQPVFTGKVLEELQALLGRYPTKQGALLPALWLVQQQRGWISDRNMT